MSDQKRPQPPALDRLDHIEQAQALIDVDPFDITPHTSALAQAHATIAIAQSLRSILIVLRNRRAAKSDPEPPKPT